MSVFETLNDKFFNPFCCKNRDIYIECINQLIEKSKEIPILYESDARSCLVLYLRNCQYAIVEEDIGEEINARFSPQDNASAILRYFRRCGWIVQQEVGRSGDNIASVTANCRKLIDAIYKLFGRDAEGAITNHIFSMYEILRASFEKDSARARRPYSTILVPLVEDESDLKNELLVLKDSIREIMRSVMRMADANSFGQFLIKDELLNRFFNDYFFIKRSGLIPSYISSIDQMLRRLRRSDLYEQMIKEYVRLKNTKEILAREIIDKQFDELDSFINLEYEQEIDYIDKRINTYYNLYTVRVMMVLGDSTNLEQQLSRLLELLKNMDDDDRQAALETIALSYRQLGFGYIGRKSFARRSKKNPDTRNASLITVALSDDEKKKLTDELLKEFPDRYSIDTVREHFDALTNGKNSISVDECKINSRDDAMMLAACIIYSGTSGFPYKIEFLDGTVHTQTAEVSNVKIIRE